MRLRNGRQQPRNIYLIDPELPGGERLCGQFDDEAIARAVVAAVELVEAKRISDGGVRERELLEALVEAMEDVRSSGVPMDDNPECWYEARALLADPDPLETVYVVYDPDEAPCGAVHGTLEEAAEWIEAYLDEPEPDEEFAGECSITEMQMRRSEREALPEVDR